MTKKLLIKGYKLEPSKPKVLFYDVETTPLKAYIWRTGKQYVDQSFLVKGDRTKIICIAYKWNYERKIHALTWDIKNQNCDKIIEEFSKIVEQADVAIAHNGDKFDVRQINTQRLMAKKKPIAWPTTEDSLKQLRKIFYFPSYKLTYIAKLLLNKEKSPMVFKDWLDIVERKDVKAQSKMVAYCKRDVILLANAYKIVQPFLMPKVSRALLTSKGKCVSCGSVDVHGKGTITLRAGMYQKYQCQTCGHYFRSTKKSDPEAVLLKRSLLKKGK